MNPRNNTTALAYLLADRACICDIECNAVATKLQGREWFDTRPMLDRREMPDEVIDMNAQALEYAEQRGLFTRHPAQPHLVRITKAAP